MLWDTSSNAEMTVKTWEDRKYGKIKIAVGIVGARRRSQYRINDLHQGQSIARAVPSRQPLPSICRSSAMGQGTRV